MSLNAFFSYFGGKTHASRYYPAPEHDTIIEPFAGAAGYSVRHFRRRVILVEKNPAVATIWRYLIRVKASELLQMPDIPESGVRSMRVPEEAKLLIGFNCGSVSGSAPADRITSWGKAEPNCSWGPVLRARLAAQVERIRHWRVIEGDYTLAPDVPATWYVDPPYEKAGTAYGCPSTDIDFPALGAWCRSRQGQVIVCEQAPAAWLPFRPFGKLVTTAAKRSNGGSVEVIWTNDETQKEAPEQEQARQRRRAAR